MSKTAERAAEWIYGGIWLVIVECFKVPNGPPNLTAQKEHGELQVFNPSRKYLSYLKLYFWVGLVAVDAAIFVGWLAITIFQPFVGALLAIPAFLVAVLPDIVAYIAIHLRFDTIWYGVSDRGVYIRRGIWVITEHTITLENVQNVSVARGPIEQLYGLSTLVVETAGSQAGDGDSRLAVGNLAIMVGLENAEEICELIMSRVRKTKTTGLGDEASEGISGALNARGVSGWTPQDVTLLQEILAEIRHPKTL